MTKPRLDEIFAVEVAKSEFTCLELYSSMCVAAVLHNYLGNSWYHFSGLAAGAVVGALNAVQMSRRNSVLEGVESNLQVIIDDAASQTGADDIAQGYFETTLRECAKIAEHLGKKDELRSISNVALGHAVNFMVPAFAYVAIAFYIFKKGGIDRAIDLERRGYESSMRDAARYAEWGKERNQKLGEKNV